MGLFGPKRDPKKVGEQSEQVIIAQLMAVGYSVLVPVGEYHRYDLVIEDADGKFWRVQCKTAWLEKRLGNEVVKFATSSSHYHYRGGKYDHGRRGYQGQVEYLAVYSPDLDKMYLIPIDHAGASDHLAQLNWESSCQRRRNGGQSFHEAFVFSERISWYA